MNLPDTNPNNRAHSAHERGGGGDTDKYKSQFRPPPASVYIALSVAASLVIFFLLLWILHSGGDETPWIPAGLAACVVFLIALAAREVVLRRALTRHILEKEKTDYRVTDFRRKRKSVSLDYYSSQLRSLQKQSYEADKKGEIPAIHLEVYQACCEYLSKVEAAIRSARPGSQSILALRTSQERASSLKKHHLLKWAELAAREWTNEAQKCVQAKEKIEAAQKALEVIDSSLKIYPEEPQLLASRQAMKEHLASLRVAEWIEDAEREAFKGRYSRAIESYSDALFYLSREEDMSEEMRNQITQNISDEVEILRERLREKKEFAKQSARSIQEDRSSEDNFNFEDDEMFDGDDFVTNEEGNRIN